jgi:hypothetical protein
MYPSYNQLDTSYGDRARRVRILILGAYRPEAALKRLEKLRDCLRRRGFRTTLLVKDLPDEEKFHDDPNIHNLLKSKDAIGNWAQIAIFVFFRNTDNVGVGIEFEFCVATIKERLPNSIVMVQEGLRPSSLLRGEIGDCKLTSGAFFDDRDLCEQVEGFCTSRLMSNAF